MNSAIHFESLVEKKQTSITDQVPCGDRISVLFVSDRKPEELTVPLMQSRWLVHQVSNPEEGGCIIERFVTPVVVVRYPVHTGLAAWEEFVKAILVSTPVPRLIVIGRSLTDLFWSDFYGVAAFDYVVEPIESKTLLRLVASAWHSWHDERQLRSIR